MEILGDDTIKYSPEETAKEIIVLKENISSANGIKSKNLIKIKFSLIDNWHCLYFSVLDKNAPFIIKRQLEEFVGELAQEKKGGAYLYYNDSYMIWLSLGQDNFPLIIFGVKDGFTDHSLTAALSYYTFSNYGTKHPTGSNSKEDNKTTSGETKTKEFTKIFKKIKRRNK